MIEISKPIAEIQVIHQRTDDFLLVLEFENIDGEPRDLSTMEPVWDIQDGEDIVMTMSGSDFVVAGNIIKVTKSASGFSAMSKLVKYRHRFYDASDQLTYFKGLFLLE